MASMDLGILDSTNITDKDVMVFKALLGLAEEDRYVYSIHKAIQAHFKGVPSITESGIRLVLKKYAKLGVLSVSREPIPSARGPAVYLVTIPYPELLELFIHRWQMRQLKLIYEAKKAIFVSGLREKEQLIG